MEMMETKPVVTLPIDLGKVIHIQRDGPWIDIGGLDAFDSVEIYVVMHSRGGGEGVQAATLGYIDPYARDRLTIKVEPWVPAQAMVKENVAS